MNQNKIINILKYSVIILFILVLSFFIVTGKKQEPIQKLLNQIELNNAKIESLQIQQGTLMNENITAQQTLLDEYGLVLYNIQEEKKEEVDEEWTPGKLNEEGTAQEMPAITGDDSHTKFKNLAEAYGLDASQIYAVEDHYRIKEGVILCITVAETSGGNRGYAGKNIGSVGSNDRGDRPTYALMESGLEAIGKTLTNQYLGKKQTLGCLSNAGSCNESNDNGKRYATSTSSRENNMVACLSSIYGSINPSSFNIRR